MRRINIAKTAQNLTQFIQTTVSTAGFSDVIVAVSGGVDSSTSVSLVVAALGTEHVHALLLPYKGWHDEAKVHARLLLANLQIPEKNIHEVDIAPMVDTFSSGERVKGKGEREKQKSSSAMNHELRTMNQLRLGNIMARTRMIVLFDFAKKLHALVLGTENKSEHYLGYYTRFGDEASDIEPLRNLYKTEVFELAKALDVPQKIISKPPTAGLWQGQTDEGQFGFSYQEADEIIYTLFEKKGSEQELLQHGISQTVIDQVKKWVQSVSFKHHLPHLAPEPIILAS